MGPLEDFSDERWKAWCIHCGATTWDAPFNEDHVPSRALLDRPLPDYPPTVAICAACNNRLSVDEEYLRVFLCCVMSGTCDPDELERRGHDKVARALRRNGRLAAEMRAARTEPAHFDEPAIVTWNPDLSRLIPPLLKNARGHFMYEMGEPPDGDPVHVGAVPLACLTPEQRVSFEAVSLGSAWPEVGSRLMQRVAIPLDRRSGARPWSGWIEVQSNVYRYAIHELSAVRLVIREYLAFEAVWG